jgi:molybdenum cofactor cytidylyltransferase
MYLTKALRLGPAPRLALVGAGGKTSVLFRLGREMIHASASQDPPRNVFLAATTHLALEQLELAEHHLVIRTPEELSALEERIPPGLVLFTGPQTEAQRSAGLNLDCVDRLRDLADRHATPLIIEADGSRQRPLKAPAPHEPVIPTWIDCVVVVAGLSGLGKPLGSKWVHRPELFSELSGLNPGETIDPAALTLALSHPRGGLKAIPSAARRVVLLNQADTPERQAMAYDMAKRLSPVYHAVLIADLAPPSSALMGTDLITAEDGPVIAVHEPVAGVILAGGSSSRLGQAKQLLPWRGQALVWHVARTALAADLSPVVVVTGFAAGDVRAALMDLPLSFVNNEDWRAGLSASVRAGLQALPPHTGGAIFLLADQPQIPPDLVRSLVESHASNLSALVAPLIDGQRANPVLFDRRTFPELSELSGDAGGRALFARYRPTWVPWHDSSLLLDVDTPEDYQRLLEI